MFRPGMRAAQIYSPHGFHTMTGKAPAYVGIAERVLSYLGDRIVAVSKDEAEHGVSLGIRRDKIVVIPNGIAPYEPLPRSEARKGLGLPADAFVVGFVGRFVDQKDPVSAVEVLNRINAHKPVVLAMIGDGDLMGAVKKKAEGALHPVKLAGLLPARPLLSAFDCLLCTSLYEGMAISFLEALNCGVPIVTYNVAGSDELVVQPESGFVTEHDAAAAAGAIGRIMAMSAGERKALSERSHAAGRYFSVERMGDATLTLYEQIIAEKP
jgi:glycosyltransferase involved in cell wall biosynthesis